MRIVSNRAELVAMMSNRAIYANSLWAHDIKRSSLAQTPLKSHQLRASIKTPAQGTKQRIIWDQPYAQYQERGMRYDGTHQIKNYTTAGTGPWFAKNAVKKSLKKLPNYFAEASQVIR